MGYPTRIYYSEADKALMWDRWRKGESLNEIGRHFGRSHTSIQNTPTSEKVPGLLSPSENKPGTFLGRICEWLLMADKGLSHSSWHNFVHRSKADAPVIGKFGPQLADPSNTISQ